MTPATAASDEPMRKVAAITRSIEMPSRLAMVWSWAVARIALPSRVRRMNRWSPIMSSERGDAR